MKVQVTTGMATYTVREGVGGDGRLTLSYATTNPPRGLGGDGGELYSWTGKPSALGVPERADGGNRVAVEFRGYTVVLAFEWTPDGPVVSLGSDGCDLEGLEPGTYALVRR